MCLARAGSAFAQGATGTLTGTVVDDTGAALPGATVNATEANTGTVRTAVSDESGLFRMAALNPGRYTVTVELANFRTLNVADISLASAEVRDLGKLSLQIGGLTETVSITSEVTPVQVADSSRRSTITLEDIANIQTKGRDIFGLINILPGVQDTNLNRDFAQWRSAISITINGMPSQNKDVRVDGLNIVDEGGCGTAYVNLNMDAIGEVQVIANGYTAENGRNNGGVISMVTRSGTNELRASGWYNGRRDRFNENDYFREATNTPKPLYRVNISGYSVGGPVVIPGLIDSRKSGTKKVYFFASQEYTDDARPTTTTRANMPTALEYNGDFSATRITNGTVQVIRDPITGQPFPGNVIPAAGSSPQCGIAFSCMDPLGQRMLRILPEANGITNPQVGQGFTSNSAYDLTPVHGRTNHVLRMDAVFTEKTRMAFRFVKDRDDDWSWNRITPGTGFVNQNTPGLLAAATLTQVLRPTVVNEMSFGYTHNRWGFKAADDFDYTSLYRSSLGVDPPRFEPFADYSDPPQLSGFGGSQLDEWPYAPRFATSGGDRAGLASFRMMDEPIPRLNLSGRFYFNNDMSITRGRHNFKMGAAIEYNRKTEPGSADYMGNFNFGHNANNPISTGNGYANMLLGIFETYTELTSRVDRDVRHWQNDFYFQDNWRMTPRLTLDLGLRVQHSGSDFEVNDMNSGFFTDDWSRNQAARVYRLVCMTPGVAGNQACAGAQQRTIDPANPGVFFPAAFNGNIVQGSGSQLNGISTGGIDGRKPGTYFTFPYFVYAPRVGFAWNVMGDGKTAIRGSWGIFYNFPRSTGDGGYPFSGGCPVSCSRQIRWSRFGDIAQATAANLIENPVNVTQAGYEQPLARSHNGNLAFQRDIGFNTVVEVAWVGNYTKNHGRFVDVNALPLYVWGNPANLVNNAPINVNSLRQVYGQYPGMGSVNQYFEGLYSNTLQYNALQLQAQRRLSNGLQMGAAYTLAKGEGYDGYDPYTDQIGGEAALRARYWGPTSDDRRHNLNINGSYDIPTFLQTPVLKQLLMDWQVSGIFRLLSGQGITPTCTSNTAGVNNSNPSLTDGVTSRCELTGEPLFVEYTGDPSIPEADRPHFNLAAFRMPQPNGSIGNFGDSGVRILRHPTWHEFDLTLSRRFPLSLMGRRNSGIRVRIEAYNVFNEVQFTNMNASYTFTTPAGAPLNSVNNNANTGKYVATGTGLAAGTIAPRILSFTARIDW